MKPFYERFGIVIYHGDCRDVLPDIEGPYVFLTDPMYGLDGGRGGNARKYGKARYEPVGWEDSEDYVRSVAVPVVELLRQRGIRGAVTPGARCLMFYPRPADMGCFWTPASVGFSPWGIPTFHPILYYGRDFRAGRNPLPTGKALNEAAPRNGHPCAKPTKAWRWLLAKVSEDGDVVVDPFLGSGTTLRVAKDLGRAAVGIEIEERWCELAARNLEQEVMDLGGAQP